MVPVVLIVEDEFVQAMALEQVVTSLGYGVLPLASTVNAALAALQAATPDAAIVDIQLDGEDAAPVIAELERRKVPIAVVTGSPEAVERRLAHHLVIGKPWGEEQLAAALREWLGRAESARAG